jgi:hypothetical protein
VPSAALLQGQDKFSLLKNGGPGPSKNVGKTPLNKIHRSLNNCNFVAKVIREYIYDKYRHERIKMIYVASVGYKILSSVKPTDL